MEEKDRAGLPEEKSRAGLIAIVAALIAAVGGIVVAVINRPASTSIEQPKPAIPSPVKPSAEPRRAKFEAIRGVWKGKSFLLPSRQSANLTLSVYDTGDDETPGVGLKNDVDTEVPSTITSVKFYQGTLSFAQGNPNKCENFITLRLNTETGELGGESVPAVKPDATGCPKEYTRTANYSYTFTKSPTP